MPKFAARGLLALASVGIVYAMPQVIADLPPPAPANVTVAFAGDIMLDRDVAVAARTRGADYIVASTTALFEGSDVRVANLEGAITASSSIAQIDHHILRFTFEPAVAEAILTTLHMSAVSLANNHVLDFGAGGYDETRVRLAAWGIHSFGHPFNTDNLSIAITSKGKTVCFVGYTQVFSQDEESPVVEEIARIHNGCWRTVVFAHWGVEYSPTYTAAQQRAAHDFIDAGADLVVGAHPHAVEPVEIYRGHAIFYSLGNFIFDQNFSWAVEHGLVVRVGFSDTQTDVMLMPMQIYEEHASVAESLDSQRILNIAGEPQHFALPVAP
ncbi:MAG: CapA family protein [Patescibacteria group bacterium]|nr:CapA family protein [Patescibacteria group bacterium]